MEDRLMDIQICLQKIEHLSPRVNSGVKVLLLMNGELTIETNSRFYQLEEKDVLVINRNQLYQVHGSKDNYVLMLNIPDAFIDQVYSEYHNNRFECYSREVNMGRELMVHSIRKLLAKLVIAYCQKEETYKIEIQGYVYQILLILIRRFKQEGSAFEKIDTGDQRLTQIIDYIEGNYGQPLTLEDVAKKLYLSPGYLSRYFKQKIGMGFSRFLMNVRLKHSLKDLLYTSLTISQISMNNGFPNTKSFANLFKEVYGETPRTFRENNVEEKIDSVKNYNLQDGAITINSPDIVNKLGTLLMDHDDNSYSNIDTRFEKLSIDLHSSIEAKLDHPDHILIVGNLRNLLREDVRSQIVTVKEELQLQYIGIMHLLNEAVIPPDVETDEVITTTSPYFNLEIALRFLKKNTLSPFIWVEYMEIMEDEERYFNKLNKFLKYCLQIYDTAYLNTWHFMFCDPAHTAAEEKELRRVYLKLQHLLKKYVPAVQVGAFLRFSFVAEKASANHGWLVEEGANIDFIGCSANQNEVIDFKDIENESFFLAQNYIKEKMKKIKAYLKEHRIEKPLHLVMWNTLSGNTRYTNGTFFRGALILKSVMDVANEVKSLGFWINSELHEEEGKHRRIQLDSLELFHYFKGKRPVYFAMLFFRRLEGAVLVQGPDFLVTQTNHGYQVVLMNCNYVNPYFSLEETFLRKFNKDIQVTITGFQAGEYQIRKLVLDKDNGALYTKWSSLNSKYGLDAEIIDYIIHSTHPSIEIFDEATSGEVSFYSYLTTNAIHFFDIRKAFV